jgi:hypothetical protein
MLSDRRSETDRGGKEMVSRRRIERLVWNGGGGGACMDTKISRLQN